ncbi:hypothetical protein I7I53_00439 [Histoplasma capsulatum var. duboisii H88]|uniref:Uncharacterized protein n=1 Tax=Ajellomyces capsulatus (strain H88) TaxID=544711 RepID=A0A8A1LLA2_AJEC8|nr:hypothetical protein I7I53_00439 [Histoplasma capsulatum var. duboisii H88]
MCFLSFLFFGWLARHPFWLTWAIDIFIFYVFYYYYYFKQHRDTHPEARGGRGGRWLQLPLMFVFEKEEKKIRKENKKKETYSQPSNENLTS